METLREDTRKKYGSKVLEQFETLETRWRKLPSKLLIDTSIIPPEGSLMVHTDSWVVLHIWARDQQHVPSHLITPFFKYHLECSRIRSIKPKRPNRYDGKIVNTIDFWTRIVALSPSNRDTMKDLMELVERFHQQDRRTFPLGTYDRGIPLGTYYKGGKAVKIFLRPYMSPIIEGPNEIRVKTHLPLAETYDVAVFYRTDESDDGDMYGQSPLKRKLSRGLPLGFIHLEYEGQSRKTGHVLILDSQNRLEPWIVLLETWMDYDPEDDDTATGECLSVIEIEAKRSRDDLPIGPDGRQWSWGQGILPGDNKHTSIASLRRRGGFPSSITQWFGDSAQFKLEERSTVRDELCSFAAIYQGQEGWVCFDQDGITQRPSLDKTGGMQRRLLTPEPEW